MDSRDQFMQKSQVSVHNANCFAFLASIITATSDFSEQLSGWNSLKMEFDRHWSLQYLTISWRGANILSLLGANHIICQYFENTMKLGKICPCGGLGWGGRSKTPQKSPMIRIGYHPSSCFYIVTEPCEI